MHPVFTKYTYHAHAGANMMKKMLENLEAKSGRSLADWASVARQSGATGQKEMQAWLKAEHGLGTNQASIIVMAADGRDPLKSADPATLVAAQYAGKKEALIPIFEVLMDMVMMLRGDISVRPGKTIVPIYRHYVIAEIKAATNGRIDFSLALKGAKAAVPKRLIETGGLEKGDRLTHRFPISEIGQADDEVFDWLKHAYTLNG
jgi:Domain of unknown function (DUF5655)/Domain of unknown function (DUF4287)